MQHISGILRAAGRRLGLTEFFDRLSVTVMAAAGAGLVVVVLERVVPALQGRVEWWIVGAALAGAAVVAALAWWMAGRRSRLSVAMEVDERLSLREALSTALLCRGRSDAFALAAVEDAERLAGDPALKPRLAREFAVRAPRRWWVGPCLALGAAGVGLWVPYSTLFEDEQVVIDETQRVEVKQIEATVEESIAEAAKKLGVDKKELEEALEEGRPMSEDAESLPETPDEVRKEAFKTLSALTEQVEKAMASDQAKALEALSEQLAQLKADANDSAATELAKALQSGDFSKAKEALEELQKKMESGETSAEEKQALADQLNRLGEQLNQLAQQNQQLQEALKQAGMDPNLANNPQALQQALQQAQNLSEAQKQQLQQMAQAQQQAAQACENMGQCMQGMASQMAGQQGMQGQMGEMGEMSAAMEGMMETLSQMEMTQMQMQELSAMLTELSGQCQGMGQGMGLCQGMGQGQGISQNAAMQAWIQNNMGGRGPGMGNRGQGAGGYGTRFATPMGFTPTKANVNNQGGPIIGSQFVESSQLLRGESAATFQAMIDVAHSRYQEELDNNFIPAPYRPAVQHFFGDLTTTAKQLAPAANEPAASDDE